MRILVALLCCFCVLSPAEASKKRIKPNGNLIGELLTGGVIGYASFYWQPQRTASGERFNKNDYTAAHKTYPFGTRVKVTNLRNGASIVVRINDRGPYIRGRIIDLSKAAASALGMISAGVVKVKIERM